MMKKGYLGLLTAFILIFLTACGSNSNEADSSSNKKADPQATSEKAALTLTDMAGREVSFKEQPKRIVALTNSDMNIIYALGGTVVGRQTQDASGVDPKEAESATEVGNTHDLNLEKIASVTPDVVVASSEQNQKDVPALEGIGTQVVLTGANSIDDIKKQVATLGELLGKQTAATELTDSITAKEQQIASQQKDKKVRSLLILGAPGSNYAALPTSLSGDILEKAGGVNIAADFKGVENFPQYAALNIEKIVQADPEIIFLMIHGGDEKETEAALRKEMKQNDAWNSTTAVKNDRIVVLPAELFGTNPGVRIDEALTYMADQINQVDNG
ncbi:ABC transporter substrate-binding protein [Listeria costaricensis]|uniref:ABC transporter substrate-binding protein n=1 Tax=Listeria costaricensis TaxID=2026604 RepID=UPI003B84723A